MLRFPRLFSSGFLVVVALLSVLAIAVPDAALAFSGRRGTRVAPVDDKVFEVVARTAGGSSDYWCGASEFARRALGAAWTARIYIVRGRGPSVTTGRRSAVQFSLDPDAAGVVPISPPVSLGGMHVGDNMSVQQASTFCEISVSRP